MLQRARKFTATKITILYLLEKKQARYKPLFEKNNFKIFLKVLDLFVYKWYNYLDNEQSILKKKAFQKTVIL